MTIFITKDFRHRRANTSYDEGSRTSGDEDFVVCMVTFTTCDLEIYVILESSVPICLESNSVPSLDTQMRKVLTRILECVVNPGSIQESKKRCKNVVESKKNG